MSSEITGKNKKDGGVTGRCSVFPHGGAALSNPPEGTGSLPPGPEAGRPGPHAAVRKGGMDKDGAGFQSGQQDGQFFRRHDAGGSAGNQVPFSGDFPQNGDHLPDVLVCGMRQKPEPPSARGIPPSMWPRARAPHVRYGRRPAPAVAFQGVQTFRGHCTFARAAAAAEGEGRAWSCLMVSSARAAFSR